MYTVSLEPNEKTKYKKGNLILIALALTFASFPNTNKEIKETIKTFSRKATILVITTVLILALTGISNQGHHPNQTISSSF